MQLEIVEGCGHFVPEERPDLVAQHAAGLFGSVARTEPPPGDVG
jgi:pimeloyl-ACP methyl ester carboxylesterase